MRWYAAKAKAGQTAIAIENLKRQSFEIYSPRIEIDRMRAGRVRRESEALFPGYVLIRFLLEPSAWRIINSTRGIQRLISFAEDGKPSPIPVGQIEMLQESEKAGKLYISEVTSLRKGDRVRIKIGPAADQLGDVLSTKGERVEFLLRLLGGKIRCIAPSHALDLVGRFCVRCGSYRLKGSSRPCRRNHCALTELGLNTSTIQNAGVRKRQIS